MVRRADGKGEIRFKDRPVTFEELDDEIMMSAIEEAFAIPEKEIDEMIRRAGLGDFLKSRQSGIFRRFWAWFQRKTPSNRE